MKILVATDGSRGGTEALRFAKRLAKSNPGSRLVVITIEGGEGFGPSAKAEAREIMRRAARELVNGGVRARFRAVRGKPGAVPEAICREADRLKADLVVVGSEGRDTLHEWVVGGVALRLVYLSRRPVTVVRPPRSRKRRPLPRVPDHPRGVALI
jgi:nucleotide-binding universal stress UspA family protein